LEHFVLLEGASVAIAVSVNGGDRFQDVLQPFLGVSHSGIASRSTRSRIRGLRPRSVITSTRHPRSCSKSYWRPPRSKRVLPGSSSTRKSISLCSSASPRATEPKTRTLRAPYLAHTRKISSRFAFKSSSNVISRSSSICAIKWPIFPSKGSSSSITDRTLEYPGIPRSNPLWVMQLTTYPFSCYHYSARIEACQGRQHNREIAKGGRRIAKMRNGDPSFRNPQFAFRNSISFVGAGPRACPVFGQPPIEKLRKAKGELRK